MTFNRSKGSGRRSLLGVYACVLLESAVMVYIFAGRFTYRIVDHGLFGKW